MNDFLEGDGRKIGFASLRFEERAPLLKALSHPQRLRIAWILKLDEITPFAAIADYFDAPQPIVSQQLAVLKRAGIVTARRTKTTTGYYLTSKLHYDLIRAVLQ